MENVWLGTRIPEEGVRIKKESRKWAGERGEKGFVLYKTESAQTSERKTESGR